MGKKILVVDNDRFVLEWMRDLLTEEGHEVITASDGLSALDILKAYVPDVVFVDLIMPNISGDKLCRIIRKKPHLSQVYLAVVSATVADDPANAELGADAYIPKGPIVEMSEAILNAVAQADRGTSQDPGEALSGLMNLTRRSITRELLANQRHLETIINNLSEGILELSLDGKVIFANNSALSLFGGHEERILGYPFSGLFEEDDRKKIEEIVAGIGAGGPEIIDPVNIQFNGKTLALKILPIEEDMVWYIIVIVSHAKD